MSMKNYSYTIGIFFPFKIIFISIMSVPFFFKSTNPQDKSRFYCQNVTHKKKLHTLAHPSNSVTWELRKLDNVLNKLWNKWKICHWKIEWHHRELLFYSYSMFRLQSKYHHEYPWLPFPLATHPDWLIFDLSSSVLFKSTLSRTLRITPCCRWKSASPTARLFHGRPSLR
jgi:hypothetical protein